MTSLRKGDADLHDENGEHITTPPTANGHQVELWQRRIERHLADHAAEDGREPFTLGSLRDGGSRLGSFYE